MLKDRYSLVLDGDDWHRGVIGIVATRIVERTGKPTLVISRDGDGTAHGSGRSIPAFHLLDALESTDCQHCFIRFGGHAHAAGFTLQSSAIETLRAGLEQYARRVLTPEDFEPTMDVDGEVTFADINKDLARSIDALEPFGVGNPRPAFATRGARLLQPVRVLKEKHAKLRLRDSDASRPYDAIGWRMREEIDALALSIGDKLDLVYSIEENTDPEFGGIQLVLKELSRSTVAAVAV